MKNLTFSLLLTLCFLSFFHLSAASIKNHTEPTAWPVILALFGEQIAVGLGITVGDVALTGTAAGLTVYFVTNPPPVLNQIPDVVQETFDWTFSEPENNPQGPRKPGKIPDWKDALLRVGLFGGATLYVVANQSSDMTLEKQLENLYSTNPTFAAYIDQLDKDYNNNLEIKIPVYKGETGIFDHFIYLKNMEVPETMKPAGEQMSDKQVKDIKNFLNQKEMWTEINQLFPESDLLLGSADWEKICAKVDCSCITSQTTIPDPCIYGIGQWLKHVMCIKRLVEELKNQGEHELVKKLWYDQVVFPGKLYDFCEPQVLKKVVEMIYTASKELF